MIDEFFLWLIDDWLMTDWWLMEWPYQSFDCVLLYWIVQLDFKFNSMSSALIALALFHFVFSIFLCLIILFFFYWEDNWVDTHESFGALCMEENKAVLDIIYNEQWSKLYKTITNMLLFFLLLFIEMKKNYKFLVKTVYNLY